jgi:copper chaperone
MIFSINKMKCGGCANTISNAIKTKDANAVVHHNLANKTITVETTTNEADIRAVLEQIGYPAE